MRTQSGEPSSQVKKEGMKTLPPEEKTEETETQQAGGKNKGGMVSGAFGEENKNQSNKSGGQGTLGNTQENAGA